MQSVRNFLFYISPLVGAVLGGLIGLYFNKYLWVFEVLFGLAGGCVVSGLMIVLAVRARFKSDPSLMKVDLKNHNLENSKSDSK